MSIMRLFINSRSNHDVIVGKCWFRVVGFTDSGKLRWISVRKTIKWEPKGLSCNIRSLGRWNMWHRDEIVNAFYIMLLFRTCDFAYGTMSRYEMIYPKYGKNRYKSMNHNNIIISHRCVIGGRFKY